MSAIPTSADRRISAALADADNALTVAMDGVPEELPTWEGVAIDNLAAAGRSTLIALTELVAVVRAGPQTARPDELAAAEGGVINAAYHLVLCEPHQVDELLPRLAVQVRRHRAALDALSRPGGRE